CRSSPKRGSRSPRMVSKGIWCKSVISTSSFAASLDRRGLIDRHHVGLLGWSRTAYHIRYTLAFSKHPIAAAVVADGMEGGYWQYLVEATQGALAWETYDRQTGRHLSVRACKIGCGVIPVST